MESRRKFIQLGGLGAIAAALAACDREPSQAANAAANRAANQSLGAPFDVSMRFFGLFGLVTGTMTSQTLDKAEVLFLSAARSSNGGGTPQHLPRLRIRVDAVKSPAPEEVDPLFPDFGLWTLEDCQVKFPQLSGAIKVGPPANVDCPDTPNPKQWHDLKWLADLSVGLGSRAKVDPNYVKDGDLSATPVATRIVLAGGFLEALQPTFKKYQPARFKMGTGSFNGPVTDLVQFTQTQVTDFAIKRKRFNGQDLSDIELKAPASGGPVYVILQNTMNPEEISSAHVAAMGHFKRLYDFHDKGLAENKRHVPMNATKCEYPHDSIPDYPVYCPPSHLYFS